MTRQEAAELLREAADDQDRASARLPKDIARTIADLLDPPRDELVKVQIAVAWTKHEGFYERGFGENHTWIRSQECAVSALADDGAVFAPTIITAWVRPPERTVAEVEGEAE